MTRNTPDVNKIYPTVQNSKLHDLLSSRVNTIGVVKLKFLQNE